MSEALRRIGGPCSVTWFAFWVTLFQNVVHHVTASPEIDGNWPLRFLAIACSQVAMFGVLLLARATVLRNTAVRPRPIATLLVFAVAGATRGTVLILVLAAVVPLTPQQILLRPIAGVLTYTMTLAFCSYLVSAFQQNKQTLGLAEDAQDALVQARDAASQELADQRVEVVEQMRAELLVQFDELTSGSPELRPQQLDTFLDDALRPASHRLAAGVRKWKPLPSQPVVVKLGVRRAVASVGLVPPFAPRLQAAFSAIFTLPIAVMVPTPRGPLALLGIFVSAWVILALGNQALSRLSARVTVWWRLAAVALATLVVTVTVGAAWGALLVGTNYVYAGVFYGLFLTPLLALMGIAAKAALAGQRELEGELERSQEQLRWDIVRVHQLQWRQQQKVARALHGPVQGLIIAEAMKMDVGPDELRSASRLRGILTEALDEAIGQDDVPTLDTTVASLAHSWSSLCEVRVDVTTAARRIEGDRVALSCLADLLGEATGNAVRHGEARNVWIVMDQASDHVLRAEVVDDGRGRNESARHGLGSQILDDCCLQWWRDSEAGGTRLQFLLPFQPAAALVASNR